MSSSKRTGYPLPGQCYHNRIVDNGMGNISSVYNALREIDSVAEIVEHPESLAGATHILLPGSAHLAPQLTISGALEWRKLSIRSERKEPIYSEYVSVCS